MIVVYTDGAMNGKGSSGIGIVIHNQEKVEEYSIPIGMKNTNQEAEFEAIVRALHICQKDHAGEVLSFRSDARVVVDAVEKDYTKNKMFQPYVKDIQHLSKDFPYFFIKWISEAENKQADRLARKAIYSQ